MEDILKGIILDERQEGNWVNGSLIKQWALQLAAEHKIEKFKASCGWLDKFLYGNELSFLKTMKQNFHNMKEI